MAKNNTLKYVGIAAAVYAGFYLLKKQNQSSTIKGIAGKHDTDYFHAIGVKYVGATNSKGAQIRITSKRFEQTKSIPYNYKFNSATEGAIDYLKNRGFNIIGIAEYGDSDIIISDTFEAIK